MVFVNVIPLSHWPWKTGLTEWQRRGTKNQNKRARYIEVVGRNYGIEQNPLKNRQGNYCQSRKRILFPRRERWRECASQPRKQRAYGKYRGVPRFLAFLTEATFPCGSPELFEGVMAIGFCRSQLSRSLEAHTYSAREPSHRTGRKGGGLFYLQSFIPLSWTWATLENQ